MSRVTSLLLRVLRIFALGLPACTTEPPVQDREEVSDGPTVYGQISVSLDQESVR